MESWLVPLSVEVWVTWCPSWCVCFTYQCTSNVVSMAICYHCSTYMSSCELWTPDPLQMQNPGGTRICRCKVPFIILRHYCTHCPCWLCTWGGASSLTKRSLANQHCVHFASAFTLVTLALCVKSGVKCQRSLKRDFTPLHIWEQQFWNTPCTFSHDAKITPKGFCGILPQN